MALQGVLTPTSRRAKKGARGIAPGSRVTGGRTGYFFLPLPWWPLPLPPLPPWWPPSSSSSSSSSPPPPPPPPPPVVLPPESGQPSTSFSFASVSLSWAHAASMTSPTLSPKSISGCDALRSAAMAWNTRLPYVCGASMASPSVTSSSETRSQPKVALTLSSGEYGVAAQCERWFLQKPGEQDSLSSPSGGVFFSHRPASRVLSSDPHSMWWHPVQPSVSMSLSMPSLEPWFSSVAANPPGISMQIS